MDINIFIHSQISSYTLNKVDLRLTTTDKVLMKVTLRSLQKFLNRKCICYQQISDYVVNSDEANKQQLWYRSVNYIFKNC